jgi:dihydroorotate dehydrogenase
MADANSDYLICLRAVYEVASYVTINISSPNTKNLRQLQNSQGLEKLLLELTQERALLSEQYGKKVPLFLKIAPDLEPGQIFEIANLLERFEIDALIATNTTISRENVKSEIDHHQSGGLSGKPIKDLSNHIVATFYRLLEGRTPIIGVGGIHTGTDALQKKNFGAKVIQIYSGLIYEGPQLIKDCINALKP